MALSVLAVFLPLEYTRTGTSKRLPEQLVHHGISVRPASVIYAANPWWFGTLTVVL
jgi:hypothetical protein